MELRKKAKLSKGFELTTFRTTRATDNRSSMTRNRHFSKPGSPEIDRPVMERDKMNAGDEC